MVKSGSRSRSIKVGCCCCCSHFFDVGGRNNLHLCLARETLNSPNSLVSRGKTRVGLIVVLLFLFTSDRLFISTPTRPWPFFFFFTVSPPVFCFACACLGGRPRAKTHFSGVPSPTPYTSTLMPIISLPHTPYAVQGGYGMRRKSFHLARGQLVSLICV